MPTNKHPARMTVLTKEDVEYLLADLQLYSGNIREITDVHGPFPHNCSLSGVIHTWMDSFSFSTSPMFCDEDSWTIQLADPVESLRRGHRSIAFFSFPKLHKDPALQERYRIANILYRAYNNFSSVSEADRIAFYEEILGYDGLKSYTHVLNAIVKDFRSYQENKREREQIKRTRN